MGLLKKIIFLKFILFQKVDEKQLDEFVKNQEKEKFKDNEEKGFYICSICKNLITYTKEKTKISGSFDHRFVNPEGFKFHIGCFKFCPGIAKRGSYTKEHSWFPPFLWNFGHCAQCGNHLGWYYQSGEDSFYVLILDRIILT